jgi:hypothetical protein
LLRLGLSIVGILIIAFVSEKLLTGQEKSDIYELSNIKEEQNER